MNYKTNTTCIVLLLTLLLGCKKADIAVCDDSESLFQQADFPIGVAINSGELNANQVYRAIAEKQFNSFTAENIFKAGYLHPAENSFYWQDADSLVNFCVNNNKRLHGHTLIWHDQLPAWIINFTGSSDEWETLYKNHIQTIVSHFRGKVSAWDVVNEAFNEDGSLRNSIWKEKIGDQYIEKAFIYAHEADPDALLFYNDFNLESNSKKRNAVISYCNGLRNRGVIVHGIGLQMHIDIFSDAAQIAESFNDVAQNGYKVHVSELDISVNSSGQNFTLNSSLFEKQAGLLGKIVINYKQIPPAYQYGITFWGVSDNESWIPLYYSREDYPLLYDVNYLPKPAYCKLKETL
jgi:endo-1,4-beta-xylanase